MTDTTTALIEALERMTVAYEAMRETIGEDHDTPVYRRAKAALAAARALQSTRYGIAITGKAVAEMQSAPTAKHEMTFGQFMPDHFMPDVPDQDALRLAWEAGRDAAAEVAALAPQFSLRGGPMGKDEACAAVAAAIRALTPPDTQP